MDFNFELALSLVNSTEQFPVDFEDAWQWLEYSRKDVAKKAFDKCGFIENVDFTSFRQKVEREIGATVKEVIKLTNECFKVWAMMAGTPKGKEVRLYFLECEKIAQHTQKSEGKVLEKALDLLEKTTQKLGSVEKELQSNQLIIKKSMEGISILEDEKFHREYYLEKINEITKEHPLFRYLLEFKLLIKTSIYKFPSVSYSIKELSNLFPVKNISLRDFAFYSSHLYFLNLDKKPDKKGVYKYSGEDLVYPLVILFKIEEYTWDTLRDSIELDYKLRFPNSNRPFLKQQ